MLLSKGWPFHTWTHPISAGYYTLLHIPFHTWIHSHFYWISCSTGYTFLYFNTFVLLLDIMFNWIYLSVLEHIRTSTGYHALLIGYTFPYLNTFVHLLDIMLYWIYLSILEHIRTSTGYHALLNIPFHTWIHSHFYWISCSTGYTFPYLNTFVLLLDTMLYVFNISRSTRKGRE